METMNYDKIKNKSNVPFISFVTFILLGSGVVAYTLVNEQKPIIIGENPLVEVNSSNVQEDNKEKIEIDYTIKSVSRTENNTSYKASIVLPQHSAFFFRNLLPKRLPYIFLSSSIYPYMHWLISAG